MDCCWWSAGGIPALLAPDVLRDRNAWLRPPAHGCICIYLTVSSKWELLPQGSWRGDRWGNRQGSACLQSHPPPAGLPQLPVPHGRWLVQADLLSLGRAPFPSYLSSLALRCSLSPGCGRAGPEQEGEFCLQWACKSCVYYWDGERHSGGLQGGCTGTFPRLRSARAIWPLHLLAACIT